MSEDNQGVPSASPAQPNMVPKERLDELIAEKRRLEDQQNVLQHLLRQAAPPRAQVQEQEPEAMLRLKESDPAMYALMKQQQLDAKQLRAANFGMNEKMDRMQFLNNFGEEGMKRLPQIEAELERLRQSGTFTDRGSIFIHMKGIESLQAPTKPKETVTPPPPPPSSNVPSSNPSSAGTTASGSATAATGRKTLAELEKDLENLTF